MIEKAPGSTRPCGVVGGPPCQGFSRGNVCSDPSDPRNHLPFRYAEILAAINEKYRLEFFVFENVMGLAGPKHADRYAKVKEAFRQAGFRVFEQELDSVLFGVPQERRRLFIVGLNNKFYPNVDFAFPAGGEIRRTVRTAIGDLPAATLFSRNLSAKDIAHHPNHWTMRPKSKKFSENLPSAGRSFRRLSWDEPSPTVAYGHREIHVHPEGHRRLSILEAMLLQGFPDTYRLLGNLSEQVTQVSNAVPPPVAEAVATQVKVLVRDRQNGGATPRGEA